MLCAKITKLHAERLSTCFPLKDVIVVLDQDQSGVSRQVHAQGCVLKITVYDTQTGTETFQKKPRFNNQYARCGATFYRVSRHCCDHLG